MRIRTQFLVTMLLFGILVTGISASAIITNQHVTTVIAQENEANSVAQSAYDLSYLANEYLIYQDSQQLVTWQNRFIIFSGEVAKLQGQTPEQKALVNSMRANLPQLKNVFDSIVSGLGTSTQNQGLTINAALFQVSWSRMAVQTQQFEADASNLSQLFVNQVNQAQRTNVIAVIVLIAIFVIYFVLNYLMMERSTLKAIATLHAGATAIGSGNLDFKIEEKQNNEIGDLSRAFNRMTASLKEVTTSKANLEKEIDVRKKIQEALQESESRFRLALKNAPVSVSTQDKDLHFLWAYNQRTINPESVLGKNDFEIFAKEDAEKLTALKRQVLATGIEINEKLWMISNGKRVYLDLFLEPVRNVSGEITGVGIATVDLTAQKVLQDTLQTSEERYRSLFETMNEGFALCEMVYDTNGKPFDYRFININPVFEKFVGLSRDKIIGHNVRSIVPNVQPKAIESFGRVAATGEPLHFENYSRDLKQWFDVYAYKTGHGQVGYLVLDITERKEAEARIDQLILAAQQEKERLSTLVNSIPDEVWFADINRKFTLANPSALREFGSTAEGMSIEGLAQSLEVLRPDGTLRPVDEAPPLRALKGEMIIGQEEVIRTPNTGELRYRQVSAAPVKDANGNIIGSVSVVRDITEMKKMESALKESEAKALALIKYAPTGIYEIDYTIPRFLSINDAMCNLTGYSREELFRLGPTGVLDGESKRLFADRVRHQLAGEKIDESVAYKITKKNGDLMYISLDVAFSRDKPHTALVIGHDVTERFRAEELKQTILNRFYSVLSGMPLGILLVAEDGIVEFANQEFCTLFNLKQDPLELRNLTADEIIRTIRSEYRNPEEALARIDEIVKNAKPVRDEEIPMQGGRTYLRDFLPIGFAENKYNRCWIHRDITLRKQAEETLKDTQRVLEEAQKIARLGSWQWNVKTGDLLWSTELYAIYDVDPRSFVPTMPAFAEFIHPDDRKEVDKVMAQLISGGDSADIDFRIIRRDKSIRYLHATSQVSALDETGKVSIYVGTTQDITERKKAQNEVIRLNRELQAIGECDQAIVHSNEEKKLLSEVCRILCTTGGYRLAWIGTVEEDEAKSVRPFVWSGDGEYPDTAKITWSDTERGRGPTGLAVRTGKTHFFQDFTTEPAAAPWREAAMKGGYRSSIAIPLKDDTGKVFMVFTLYSTEPNYFDPAEVKLLEVLAGDLSFGINGIREKAKRKLAEDELAHVASIPELNPSPIVELDAEGRIIYLNPAAKSLFPDILSQGIKHPFLSGWQDTVRNVKSEKEYLFDRQVMIGRSWYIQTFVYVQRTNHYHIYGRDITERKYAEDALVESESLMRAFFDSPGVMRGIVEIVDDSTIRHILDNMTTSGFIGMRPETLINKLSSELGEPAEIIRLWVEHYRESQKTRKPINFEYLDRRGDNSGWLSVTVSYLRTTDSGQTQFGYVAQDISELKKMEEILQNNENRFRLLSEVNSLLLTTQQPEQSIQIIAGKVMKYLDCEAFFNFIIDETKGRLRLNAYSGITAEAAGEIEWLDFGSAICGCVARDNKPIVSENVQENGDERAALVRSYGIKAYASYPLHVGKNITGTVSFGTRSRTSFTSDQLGLIELVADQISVAMQRKKSEDNLKESEERFYKAFYASPAALSISRVDDGKFIDVNPSFLNLFRYSREEIIGHLATEIDIYDNPDDRKEIVRILKQKGQVVNYEVTARTKTGVGLKALTSAEQIEINGQAHIIWTTIDITEREQAEALLRETTDYLNNLFNYANAPIIVWDPQFRISRFNPAFERLTGYQTHEVLGEQLGILFPPHNKAQALNQIRRTIEGERFEVIEIPVQRINGEVRTILWNSANVYDNDGRTIIATIAQGQDITERKQAEEKLQETTQYLNNLLDYANAPIIVWDSQFRITRFNHAFENLTGTSAEEAIGKNLDLLFPEDSKTDSMNHINEAMSGRRWEAVEIPILRKNGDVRIVLWNSATLLGIDGKKMVATIAQGQDITERKQAEEEVKKLNEELKHRATELEAANRELEAFSYSVSHDLRAPLRTMQGFSQALMEDCVDTLNDQCKDYLQRIQGSAELMAQLIDDMLQLSRLTRADMLFDEVNLSEMAQMIAKDLKTTQPKREVEFSITRGLIVKGDEQLLRVALHNLMENAFKFTGKVPKAHIEVGVTRYEGEKAYFVRDNGAGFDMAYVSKIFNPFQRLHTATEFPGTGIGLASVQRIIHRHGGKVWAEGKVGKGATFYFTLNE